MAMLRLVYESYTANLQATNLVVFPAYFAIEPEGISSAQTRPGGIKATLQNVRRGHVGHPASLGRQLIRYLGARPEACEDSDCGEHSKQHA